MKKFRFPIIYAVCCIAAILISLFYLTPPYWGKPFKNLKTKDIEMVYVAYNKNLTQTEEEMKNFVKQLNKIKITGKGRFSIDSDRGFKSILLKNGKTIKVDIRANTIIIDNLEYRFAE